MIAGRRIGIIARRRPARAWVCPWSSFSTSSTCSRLRSSRICCSPTLTLAALQTALSALGSVVGLGRHGLVHQLVRSRPAIIRFGAHRHHGDHLVMASPYPRHSAIAGFSLRSHLWHCRSSGSCSRLSHAGRAGPTPQLSANSAWRVPSGLLWLAGGLASGAAASHLWVDGGRVDSSGPAVGFYTPGLGRSTTKDWNIAGDHMAERCELFLLIALGESVLVTGGTFGQLDFTPVTLAAFVVAFLAASRSGGSISISAPVPRSSPSRPPPIPGGWDALPTPIFTCRWSPGSSSPPSATSSSSPSHRAHYPGFWPPFWAARRCSWRGTCCSNMRCSAMWSISRLAAIGDPRHHCGDWGRAWSTTGPCRSRRLLVIGCGFLARSPDPSGPAD